MHKIKTIITTLLVGFILAGNVHAANISVRISTPKTPTNLNSFDLSVVSLDFQERALTVKCYKKTPTDAGFTQFGSDIALTAGGDSTVCSVSSSIIGNEGTYQFYATAQSGAEIVTSETVSVEYKTGGPETPNYNGKERINTCDYKIKFHTADDSGKTVKVEIYRSENTSFTADSGTRVDTISIGSNQDGYSITTPPSCSKEYYFAIRAFDTTGNGSGLAGDSETHTTYTTIESTTTSQTPETGAIPIPQSGSAGSVLGEVTKDDTKTEEGSVLGEEASPSPEIANFGEGTPAGTYIKKIVTNPFVIAGVILLVIAAIFYARKNK